MASNGYASEGVREVSQTRTMSAIESVTSAVIKFLWAMFMWQFVVGPLFGYEVTLYDNFLLTSCFTISSLIIGYLIRRYFNNKENK